MNVPGVLEHDPLLHGVPVAHSLISGTDINFFLYNRYFFSFLIFFHLHHDKSKGPKCNI